jgi:hypothetical protein
MSQRIQRVYFGDEPEASVRDLLSFSESQLEALARFLDRYGPFGGEMKDVLSLAGEVGLSFERTVDILRHIAYLESERSRLQLTADGMLEEFETYLDRHPRETQLKQRLGSISTPLKRIFSDRPEVAFRSKVATVTGSVVPQAVDFYSLCDLRPVFNDDREQPKALEYVPVALVRVIVRSDPQEANSSLIFQMDRNGVSKLEEFLDRVKKKMAFLEGSRTELLEKKI